MSSTETQDDGSLLCTACGHWIVWSGPLPPKRGMCSCELDDASAASIVAQQREPTPKPYSRHVVGIAIDLAPDPFERIELAAACWRNAYRAHERRDRPALEQHLREAVDHGIALIRGLYA